MHILYATDGSDAAADAGRFLGALPLRGEDTVTIVSVVERGSPGSREAVPSGRAALAGSRARLDAVEAEGHPADEIVRAAEEMKADLIAIGSRGHSNIARFLVGSVAERVVRHAHSPVLMVRPPVAALRRVLLGLDGSDASRQAAQWLRAFPLPQECEVRLVTFIPYLHDLSTQHLLLTPPLVEQTISLHEWERNRALERLEAEAGAWEGTGHRTVTELRSGEPAGGLIDVAQDEDAQLVVVGSHAYGTLDRFLLGSVSENLIRHAHSAVLVVKEPAPAS